MFTKPATLPVPFWLYETQDRNRLSSVSALSKAICASKCAPDPNSMFSRRFCIQWVIATNVGIPRSLVTSSTQSRRPA